MVCVNNKKPKRTLPPEVRPGDLIVLKTCPDALPFAILGSVVSMPAYYVARRIDSLGRVTEVTIRRCEIASITRLPEAVVKTPDGKEIEPEQPAENEVESEVESEKEDDSDLFNLDWTGDMGTLQPDAPIIVTEEPLPTLNEILPDPQLVWGPPNSTGELMTMCRQFQVIALGSMWQGKDCRTGAESGMYAVRESAISWCEGRYDPTPAPVRLLSWVKSSEAEGAKRSTCGNFEIVPTLSLVGEVVSGVFHAVDNRLPTGHKDRLSDDGCRVECDAWCEERARLSVAWSERGAELVDNSIVPF